MPLRLGHFDDFHDVPLPGSKMIVGHIMNYNVVSVGYRHEQFLTSIYNSQSMINSLNDFSMVFPSLWETHNSKGVIFANKLLVDLGVVRFNRCTYKCHKFYLAPSIQGPLPWSAKIPLTTTFNHHEPSLVGKSPMVEVLTMHSHGQ